MTPYRIAFYVDSVPFTPGILAGVESLGGSESACVGLARALAARGHAVTIYATQLDEACVGLDHAGVQWDHADILPQVNRYLEWDVFVALRMYGVFRLNVRARLRILWNQDLLCDAGHRSAVMSHAWAYDKIAYVSEFHRRQWEHGLPELAPIGWATRNGYDPAHVPASVAKNPKQVIHISRPERGLRPLLAMWPMLRAKHPDAVLKICRYSSMYDAGGWGEVCKSYDAAVAEVNAAVGGIEYLGELGKPALYRAIAESAVMWYPGVADFGETSCIAAIESQACGTPFVGSYKGALPETVPSGVLVKGNADADADYHSASVAAVSMFLRGCENQTKAYRDIVSRGRSHVSPRYAYGTIAEEWDAWITETFETRSSDRLGVLRQLLREDDHTAALQLAIEMAGEPEAEDAVTLCQRVIAGKEHTSEQYAEHALDTDQELTVDQRFRAVAQEFSKASALLDVACGNGAAAITFALQHPTLHVHGVDYAAANIAQARAAAERHGVSDRVTFACLPVWDFETGSASADFEEFASANLGAYDALFCGEFIEHVADCSSLVRSLESLVSDGGRIVFTCPSGMCRDLMNWTVPLHRGHVHRFATDDLLALFGAKRDLSIDMLGGDETARGTFFGNWVTAYTKDATIETGTRDYAHRIRTTRPMPRLTVAVLAKNAEFELGKCLSAVWPVADEILVGINGTWDDTAGVAAKFGATLVPLPTPDEHPDGFAGLRNELLARASGDWFFWVDTDETVLHASGIRKYLESDAYNGYVVRQNHLMLDAPVSFDTPVRVFRRSAPIQFYGCVHEQPQMVDCNTDITPALDAMDVQIAHTGYLTEPVRRHKMMGRNLPLLQKDATRFPDRALGKVLILRDYVNLAQYEFERTRHLSDRAKHYLTQAIGLFEKHFREPGTKLHDLARPYYDMALKLVSGAVEVEIALAGRQGGLGQDKARPSRLWVRSFDDLEREVQYRLLKIRKQMTPDKLLVDPFDDCQHGTGKSSESSTPEYHTV